MRGAYATIRLVPGRGQEKVFNVPAIETWQTEQSIDNDADSFTVDIGDHDNILADALDRDTEVRAGLFYTDDLGRTQQVFAGIADQVGLSTQFVNGMAGRDVPSAILMDVDAEPGIWHHKAPKEFLTERGRALGLTDLSIAPMKEIPKFWSDASEKEWSFWYRIARMGGMYMWSTNTGGLIIDGLAYSLSRYDYSFGHPLRGEQRGNWIGVEDVQLSSNKQQRLFKVTVYGEDKKKKGKIPVSVALDSKDTSINAWLRKPTSISSSSVAQTQKDLDTEAKTEMFESIVGAQEHTLTIRDTSLLVKQNTMARINLPEYGLVGNFYVVGVSRSASVDGLTQVVRVRERGFAITNRVPEAPTLKKEPNAAESRPTANIASGLHSQGIRWYGAFVRAAREFGSGPGTPGWDLSLFLGVLISISAWETRGHPFSNVRQGNSREWEPMPTETKQPSTGTFQQPPYISGATPVGATSLAQEIEQWKKDFGNAGNDLQYNPYSPDEAGVGPMQLTTKKYKDWADQHGFSLSGPPKVGEFDGGRWHPESNIRAGARALIEKAKAVGANPLRPSTIWNAVAAYNGAGPQAQKYADAVKALFDNQYNPIVSAAILGANKVVPGSAQQIVRDGSGREVVDLSAYNAPHEVVLAITWAVNKIGDKYQWGGSGNPGYDCSSFVTKAMVFASPTIRAELGDVTPGNHGPDTFALRDSKYGKVVTKDGLLPGDLVFFNGINGGQIEPWGHVGMYIGNDHFIQDPNSREVVKISGLNEDWYRQNYLGARRFFYWPGKKPQP